jgi:serine protease inhibitor
MFSDVNRPVKNDFSQAIQVNYGAYLDSVDFTDKWAAAQKINQYVKNSTNNRIRQIINQEDLNDAQLMLLSAIYFRGQWKVNFYNLLVDTCMF